MVVNTFKEENRFICIAKTFNYKCHKRNNSLFIKITKNEMEMNDKTIFLFTLKVEYAY